MPPLQSARPHVVRLSKSTGAAHFARISMPDFPRPLAVLSERERQVCLGMLAGQKGEAIVEDMRISANGVVTYRQRAHQKLGMSSRGQLFSICRDDHGVALTE